MSRKPRMSKQPTPVRWFVLMGVALLAFFALPRKSPATIAEQRERLPPAAECDHTDPITGVWQSHAYYPGHGQWYIFTLTIRRSADDENVLEGTVHSHYWTGNRDDEEPPPCGRWGYHQTVIMPAEGTVEDELRIEFGGTSWEPEQNFCGPPVTAYYPDVFSGLVDPDIEEFQSVNNDGGPMVDYPTVFRRVRCLEEEGEYTPPVELTPPSFYPDDGCSCLF